jgi:hypothetical protein
VRFKRSTIFGRTSMSATRPRGPSLLISNVYEVIDAAAKNRE